MIKSSFLKRKPWIVWFSAALFPMYQFMMQGSPSVMIPELVQALNIDAAQIGFLTTSFFFSYIAMQIPAGILIDLFGPKIVLLIGLSAAVIAALIFSSSRHLWVASSSRIIMGLTCAPGIVATLTLASNWFKSERFAFVVGLTETLCMLGAALGTFILALCVHHFGWRMAIILCAILGAVIALNILINVKNYPKAQFVRSDHLEHFSLRLEWKNLVRVIKEPQAWIAGLYSGLMFSVFPALFALWGLPFFMDRYQISSPDSALIVSMGFIGAAVGAPIIGGLSSILKRRKIVMIFGAFITLLLYLSMLYFDVPLFWSYPFAFFLGFFVISNMLAFPLVSEILPMDVKGKSMGFVNTLTLLIGAPILQPLIGKRLNPMEDPLTKDLTEFTKALYPIAFALAFALILSFFVKETYCKNKYPLNPPQES